MAFGLKPSPTTTIMTENNTTRKVEFLFPYPPSVNTYWGFNGSRRYLTKKAVDFKKIVKAECMIAGNPSFGKQLVRVSIVWCPPDRRVRDIDNPIKPLFDAIVQAGVIEDDSQIKSMTVDFDKPVKGGRAQVIIQLF